MFEIMPFDAGTNALAKTAAELTQNSDLISIAGGGDTAAALENAQVADQFTYISTAGGAFPRMAGRQNAARCGSVGNKIRLGRVVNYSLKPSINEFFMMPLATSSLMRLK